jgi:TPR repeat protein
MTDPETLAPKDPEPGPDATQRLTVGVPMDPAATQRLDLSAAQAASTTQKIQVGEPSPAETQKLVLPLAGDPPIRVQKTDQPAQAQGQTQARPATPAEGRPWLGGKLPWVVGALAVLGVMAYLALGRNAAPAPAAAHAIPATEPIPAGAQVYLEQAKTGDAHAMRMLGVMYYYGLNVPQDREKGLYWYRQAAEKGSDAARSELARLEAVK